MLAAHFRTVMEGRRSVRHFSPEPIAHEVIDKLIRAAGTAPCGAHKQPWSFYAMNDPALKRAIREASESEERTNCGGRMPPE